MPAFECGNPFLKDRDGRVRQPRVDVAERLQVEEGGSVVDVVEDIGRRLVDRRAARARRRIGCGAGVYGECFEALRDETVADIARRAVAASNGLRATARRRLRRSRGC